MIIPTLMVVYHYFEFIASKYELVEVPENASGELQEEQKFVKLQTRHSIQAKVQFFMIQIQL